MNHEQIKARRIEISGSTRFMKLSSNMITILFAGFYLCCSLTIGAEAQAHSDIPAKSGKSQVNMESALVRAGDNRKEIQAALDKVPSSQSEGMRFLIENMPESDLQSLKAAYLLENVAVAYEALNHAPWKQHISKEIFLNDVLPYSCLNERRDDSRKLLREKSLPLIAECATPAEAAHLLNQKLFPLLNARYSTERKRPDQSPLETIESGKATCSGLSILLVDACRAVGIPARVVGTPLWTNLSGNHTWVEIWDGSWHFAGAAEPDSAGLDHGWFVDNASKAQKDNPKHSIYASSFKKSDTSFPLVWAPDVRWVPAVNVTERYTALNAGPDAGRTKLMVRVLQSSGKRAAAKVTLKDLKGEVVAEGVSKDETADLNNLLGFKVFRSCPPRKYKMTVQYAGKTITQPVYAGMEAEETISITLPPDRQAAPSVPSSPSASHNQARNAAQEKLTGLLKQRFAPDPPGIGEKTGKLLLTMPADVASREIAWQCYKSSFKNTPLQEQFEKNMVSTTDRTSPYRWRHVGTKPADGWGLVIAMHGGGGAPKEVNDREWDHMYKTYYHEHPEAGGYVYLALRAPNDSWNGFYDDAIGPLVEKLILQFVLFDDVDPNKVYTLGASHGGYGAFVIGTKIPYRFAAVHASASAPTDGETRGENLRDTRFTYMVGEKDTAYGRADRCQKFSAQVEEWRKQYGGYPGELEFIKGAGHFVPDHDKVAEMLKSGKRDPYPKEIVWSQSDTILKRFYWIEADAPVNQGRLEAKIAGNTITIKAEKQETIGLWLDNTLVDMTRPVTVTTTTGKKQTYRLKPNLETYCKGLEQTGDRYLAAPVYIIFKM